MVTISDQTNGRMDVLDNGTAYKHNAFVDIVGWRRHSNYFSNQAADRPMTENSEVTHGRRQIHSLSQSHQLFTNNTRT